jgi:anaerobic selenocysteine-containing dehydrogenase
VSSSLAGERTIRAACPHDCPDTCAMLVTVADGRATRVAGDPDHPVTAGFLCGKVATYVERTYAEDRILQPLLRDGPKGAGRFCRATWDEALDAAARGIAAAIDRHGGEALLPYSYYGTMGVIQRDAMSARLMNALGASALERTICASAGLAGVLATHGPSPEVDPEEWPHARLVVAWGWNPLSTAPHLWRLVLEARRAGARLVVVDPYRSRTARVADEHVAPLPGTDAALALGMMRAIVDAGLADEAWCREHAVGYDELLARLEEYPVDRCAALCDVPAETIERLGRELAERQPSLLRLGVGAQRHLGAPLAYRTLACLPALAGSWRHRGGGLSYIPSATAGTLDSAALARPDLRPGPVRTINMSAIGDALTDSELSPPVGALVVWNANPAAIAPDQERVLAGLAREDLFTVALEQFPTDTTAYADVVLPATTQLEHLDALWSWGHHYLTWNEPAIAPLGEAKPNTEIFRLLAGRLGLDNPCFSDSDEALLEQAFAGAPAGITIAELRRRGYAKVDLGQGPVPHGEGVFPTPSGRLELHAAALGRRGLDPLPGFDPPAEVLDAELAARYPLCLLTPKTHLFLNSTFANGRKQRAAQPRPFVVLHPADAADRRVADGETVRVFNDRGSFRCEARVSDDARPGVAVAPMGWWNADWQGGRSCQATTSQRLTEALTAAPTFNDNRVEVERTEDGSPGRGTEPREDEAS